ncbi:solute symporter family transporter [Punctularia strigosozonata HHB-11173 SS5]|uniref:solute symporter family transporter n=1 Tax=Punctularia strigosozonata (strain HHB-11173) TaxID=741275 RepID=UPI0004417839|nr:solute symporter family transporter [Punctularia strigosozonata HHB-11173 SS5]EIN11216.1 solute symporter family transporter [Punctularia strigosozonata HHB-11173 SS5]
MAESEFRPLLSQSVGYGVVVGVGFFFAAVMLVLTYVQTKHTKLSPHSSEEFSSASRSVKPGLVCCGIVSAWTWSATLLQSSTAAYTFGVSGPWWYGVGGTIQLGIFAMVAAKVKINANGAHTFLEIVKVRFGTAAHLVFTFYAVLCNLVVSGSLILGGAATVNALTGMPIIAACFLLPIGIAVYVVFGGLRATFICDYAHTVILFTIIYLFIFRAYGTAEDIGSPNSMYDLLAQAARNTPVVGNQNGSYLTMKSNQGLVFGATTILSGFAGVFCDQGYWQRAIASAPESTTKAYMLGGLSWFAVPWAFASCLGLAARALLTNPKFPTYPNPLSASQASAGLAAPAAAAVLMGKGGAVAILLVVFMAVTSAASAELIAVSSIFSYDLYRVYWRKTAGGTELVRVSHYFIVFWAIWMGAWSTIVNKASIDLGWLFYVQGAVLSPAVIPVALTVGWSKLTAAGVLSGSIIGAILGILAWMIGCLKIYGTINITNLALPYSAICSGLTGLLFSGIITVVVSLLGRQNYDFSGTRAIAMVDPVVKEDMQDVPEEEAKRPSSSVGAQEKNDKDPEAGVTTVTTIPVASETIPPFAQEGHKPASREVLQAVYRRAAWMSLALTLCVAILVPLPMFFSHYVFSKEFFTFWIACTIIWAFLSGTFCIILPVVESRKQILTIVRASLRALRLVGHDHSKA